MRSNCPRQRKWPTWTGDEPDLGVTEVVLSVGRNRARVQACCLVTFSLHAIARRLQRAADGSVESLLRDIDLAAQAASGELTAGAGYKVTTDAEGGGRRGRALMLRDPSGATQCVLSIRTWIEN